MEDINIKDTAQVIVGILESCGFDDITDSSGYYVIREFEDGTERCVDVHKSTNDGKPHYVVYCSYEDENFDYKYTEDLTIEALEKVLEEIYESEEHDIKVICLQCGHKFELTGASNDEFGWHTTCPICSGSFDINIEEHLIPNGTKVKFGDKIGIIDGNDVENSEEFEDINYFICPLEHTHKEVWSNDYVFLLREDFEIYQ